MGCRIMRCSPLGGSLDAAVMYCSTTMWAFGPLFRSIKHAEEFIKFVDPIDPRKFSDNELEAKVVEFNKQWTEDEDA
jgi:hypothetical protein